MVSLEWRLRFTTKAGGGPRSPSHAVAFFETVVVVAGFPPLPWHLEEQAKQATHERITKFGEERPNA